MDLGLVCNVNFCRIPSKYTVGTAVDVDVKLRATPAYLQVYFMKGLTWRDFGTTSSPCSIIIIKR